MRAAVVCAMTVAALLVLAAGGVAGGVAGGSAAACPTSAGMKDASKKTKPSSFAPRPKPPHNAYGQPIGEKILTKRVKKQPPAVDPPAT
jgi:hypothetical protein